MSQLPHSFEKHYELLLQRVLELSDDAILVFNHEHVIVYANPAAAKIFGKEAEQIIGSKISTLLPEDKRHTFESAITSLTTSTNHSISLRGDHEFVGLRANQDTFYAHGKLAKLQQGELPYLLVLQDVTWKKALENELENTLLHLREVEDKVEEHLEHPSIMDAFPTD